MSDIVSSATCRVPCVSVGDVQVLTARKTRSQDSFGRSISSTSSTGAGGSSSRLTPPPHANLPPQQQHQAPPPPAQPQQPSYLDAITELQQVNQAVKAELRKHHITSKHVFPVTWVVLFLRSINTNILAAGKISSRLLVEFECSWQAGCKMHRALTICMMRASCVH